MDQSGEKYIKKTFLINNEEVEIVFYNETTEQELLLFIQDVEEFYLMLKDDADLFIQQLAHALLVIKHFTNFEINTNDMEDFVSKGKMLLEKGLLNKIAINFDKRFVDFVNRSAIKHFILTYDLVPEYLVFGSNKATIKQLEEEIINNIDNIGMDLEEYYEDEEDLYIDYDDEDEEDLYVDEDFEFFDDEDSIFDDGNVESIKRIETDDLLDEYNDYMTFYKIFKDKKYKLRADHILRVLKGEEEYIEQF